MSGGEFYWCLEHNRVEGPHEDKAARRMGPYPTREAAENWKATVDQRNESWDGDDSDEAPDDSGA